MVNSLRIKMFKPYKIGKTKNKTPIYDLSAILEDFIETQKQVEGITVTFDEAFMFFKDEYLDPLEKMQVDADKKPLFVITSLGDYFQHLNNSETKGGHSLESMMAEMQEKMILSLFANRVKGEG